MPHACGRGNKSSRLARLRINIIHKNESLGDVIVVLGPDVIHKYHNMRAGALFAANSTFLAAQTPQQTHSHPSIFLRRRRHTRVSSVTI
jgi:urate oxidase